MGALANLVENLLQSLTPENFVNIVFFPMSWTVSTGTLRQGFLSVTHFSNEVTSQPSIPDDDNSDSEVSLRGVERRKQLYLYK